MKSSYKGALKGFKCNPFSLMPFTSRHVFIDKKFYMIVIALVVNHSTQKTFTKSFFFPFGHFKDLLWRLHRLPLLALSLLGFITAPFARFSDYFRSRIEKHLSLWSKAKRLRFALLFPAWTTENCFIVTLILSYRLHCNCQVVHLK